MKSNTSTIIKTAIVFDSILNLEREIGILLPLEDLIKNIKDDAKRYNEKLKVKEIKEILKILLLTGIIFYPKKDYVERFSSYNDAIRIQKIKENVDKQRKKK